MKSTSLRLIDSRPTLLASIPASTVTQSAASESVETVELAALNGQLLIGSTGLDMVLNEIDGTANQVIVTNGAGTITLSLPQSIHTGATPMFVGLTLSGLTAKGMLYADASKAIASTAAPTHGQLLIGSTGNVPALGTLTGTLNQITVTNGAGSITLALPQDIHAGASPTFAAVSAATFTGALTGNAATATLAAAATVLATPRTINGVSFDGSGNITVPAAAGTLTGGTLAAGVTASSLTSVGTLTSLGVTGTVTAGAFSGPLTGAVTGNASTATALANARNINGVAFDGTGNITVTAAAGTLTGATLAANVLASSLTSVGLLAAPHMTSPVVDSGGLTVTAGGITVTAGSVTAGTFVGALTGNASTATALQTARTINGTSFNGTANITVPAAAGTLTGTTLAATVVTSSLTSVGTLTGLVVSGSIYINGTTNAKSTVGLTINQGAADDEIFTLKSSDVAHGITDVTETDTFGLVTKILGNDGGFAFVGLTETVNALLFSGYATTEDTTKATTSGGNVRVTARLKSGTGATTHGADANIYVIRNNATTRFIFDGDGDSHEDVGTSWTNFDEHDDVALLTLLSAHVTRRDDPLRESFGGWLAQNRAELERLKLVTFNDDIDGHAFVNRSRVQMLLIGAARQMAERIDSLERRLLEAGR